MLRQIGFAILMTFLAPFIFLVVIVILVALLLCGAMALTFGISGLLGVVLWYSGDAAALPKAIEHLAFAMACSTVIVVASVLFDGSTSPGRSVQRPARYRPMDFRTLGAAMQEQIGKTDEPFVDRSSR